jgi:hypothetical protein
MMTPSVELGKALSACIFYIIPILNQSAIFVGVVVGFLNVYTIRLVAFA